MCAVAVSLLISWVSAPVAMKQSNSGHSFGPRDGRAPARIRIISTSSGATGVMKYYGKVPNQIPARQELPQGVKLSRNDMKCVAKQKAAPGYLHNARGRDCCVAVVQNWRTSNGISSCSSLFLTHTLRRWPTVRRHQISHLYTRHAPVRNHITAAARSTTGTTRRPDPPCQSCENAITPPLRALLGPVQRNNQRSTHPSSRRRARIAFPIPRLIWDGNEPSLRGRDGEGVVTRGGNGEGWGDGGWFFI